MSNKEKEEYKSNFINRKNLTFSSNIIKDTTSQFSIQNWSGMECYQLSPGHELSKIDKLEFKSIKVIYECHLATVQKIGSIPKNICIFFYCNPIPKFRFSGIKRNTEDTLYFLPEMSEYDIFIPKGAKTTYIILEQDFFLENVNAFNPALWKNNSNQLFSFESKNKIFLKKTLNMWLKVARGSEAENILLEKNFIDECFLKDILRNVTSTSKNIKPSSSEQSCAFHTYRMARNFIKEQLDLDIVPTISQICQSIYVSERTLQYAFHSCVNMTPTAYLRLCRLHCVRETLQKSDPKTTTVTYIAMHFGFYHLGRFSLNYKKIFSESPSATLNH